MAETLKLNKSNKAETSEPINKSGVSVLSEALQKPTNDVSISESNVVKVEGDEPKARDAEGIINDKIEEKNNGEVDGNRKEVSSSEDAESEEVQVAEATESKPETKKPEAKSVPLATFLEERKNRQRIERQLEEMRAAQVPPPPPPPDKTTEYDAWLEHEIGTVKETQRSIQEKQALDEIGRSYATSSQVFQSQNADYMPAVSNMIEIYASQLAEDGFEQPQIEAAAQYQIMQMTVEAMKRGMNPAEYIYRKASKLPRLAHYMAQNSEQTTSQPQNQQQPVKKDVDIGRLAEAKRKNSGISGNTGFIDETIPDIARDNPLKVAFSKDKQKEWEKQREKLFKNL